MFPSELGESSGTDFVYSTFTGALAQPPGGSGDYDVYRAKRAIGGWGTTDRISRSSSDLVWTLPGGVSSDHGYTFSNERGTDYLRKPDGTFELTGIGSLNEEPYAQGRYISAGGQHVIFSTGTAEDTQSRWCHAMVPECKVLPLDANAPPEGTGAVYDRAADGEAHVVSLLPGNQTPLVGEQAFFKGTSKDASSIAFTIGGTLYVRIHNGEPLAEESLKVAEGSFAYAGLSETGRYLFYVDGGNRGTIHRLDTSTDKDIEVDPSAEAEVVNVSADGSRVYFISREALTGGEENDHGEVARAPAVGTGSLAFAKGTGTCSAGSKTITGVSTGEGAFAKGMEISGFCIPPETTIAEVGPGTLTLSEEATGSGKFELLATSKVLTGVSTGEGAFAVGMEISGPGIPPRTVITEVSSGTLTLSERATKSETTSLFAGFPNMYVWDGDTAEYVATVRSSDLVQTSPSPQLNGVPALTNWTTWVTNPPDPASSQGPGGDASRSTPDGSVLVFESRARLTSYDNDGHTEIYRYDVAEDELSCVSCNPRLEPAEGNARLQALQVVTTAIIHNVSDDGSRVVFETPEPLVERDTNESNDVYEWEEEGAGPGLAKLISSGKTREYQPPGVQLQASASNLLMSVTPSGSDIFFMAKEAEALVPGAGENGTQSVYDARVNGGFPPPAISNICREEECKSAAKDEETRSEGAESETITGAGNFKQHKHKARCRRGHKASKPGKKHSCSKSRRKKASARTSSAQDLTSAAIRQGGDTIEQGNGAAEVRGLQQDSALTGAAPAASTCTPEFGIENWEGNLSTAAAGMHPDFTTRLEFNRSQVGGVEETCEAPEEIAIHLPPGLLGNPAATRTCSMGEFTNLALARCPASSQVGISVVRVGAPLNHPVLAPVYNLTPPHPAQEVARFGFLAYAYPVFIDVHVRTAGDYGVTATVKDPPGLGGVVRAKTTLWADPSSASHDEERWLTPLQPRENCTEKEIAQAKCKVPPPGNPSEIPPAERKSFMTNPSACQEMPMGVEVRSYQQPDKLFTAPALLPSITECSGLPFTPSFEAEPTSHLAGAPTGLKTVLKLPQHLGEGERYTATMREARVTLPAGMQVAAGAANWIGTCSGEQIGYHEEVDSGCPDNSKLGTATLVSPDLPKPIEGTIYQRSPEPGHQLGLWLASDALGLHIKLPAFLEPDKQTGRLTAVFKGIPQVPVEEIDLNVWGGPRAPLQNSDHCGSFTTDFSFIPHSNDPAVFGQSTMKITEGCNQGFSPALKAGVTEPRAGKFSPFVFDLSRPDGDQALRGFSLHLPEGELAKIAGVPLCPDSAAGAGSCPAGSRIGSLKATTGPGPEPLSIPQPGKAQPQIYLAGPYQGAPFSILSEVPAQAGPFDLGTLAVRSGLEVDPESGQATVKADPLPQFFEGVGIAYRHLHAVVDRPEFNLNPTNCSELHATSDVTSTLGTVAHPSARFQVDGCKALKFKPKLSLKLKGGTKRAQYPALTAVLKARKDDANIAFTSVALPHSEFLAQEHIGTVCTRVQFAAYKCPKGSVYGKAKAVTPLLDKPLSGPVYLRSSNHPLPDLVAKLGGQLEIDLVGRIDSVHGGIRTTFESVPDAPVSRFVLQMRGGSKGLLTNSTDICRGSHRAIVRMKAQNGRVADLRPSLVSSGCGKKKLGKHKKHH